MVDESEKMKRLRKLNTIDMFSSRWSNKEISPHGAIPFQFSDELFNFMKLFTL